MYTHDYHGSRLSNYDCKQGVTLLMSRIPFLLFPSVGQPSPHARHMFCIAVWTLNCVCLFIVSPIVAASRSSMFTCTVSVWVCECVCVCVCVCVSIWKLVLHSHTCYLFARESTLGRQCISFPRDNCQRIQWTRTYLNIFGSGSCSDKWKVMGYRCM